MSGMLLIPVFLLLTFFRQNVILTLAVIIGLVHSYIARNSSVEYLVQDLWFTLDRELLLSIPMFIFAGVIMSSGSISARLVRLMKALTSPFRGGLAIATILAMAVFSSISGSAIVTMMAVGTLMYPALIQSGYSVRFTLGLLCTGGTLGVIIPPSILMILYGLSTDVSVTNMFMAGWGPGLLMVLVLCVYSVICNRSAETSPFDIAEVWAALKHGITALLMPVILMGGIYSGIFTVTEAAAVSLLYALLIEVVLFRNLGAKDVFRLGLDTVKLLGSLMPLVAFAGSLNVILQYEGVPQALVAWTQETFTADWQMLIMVNLMLLVAGALMDESSAIIILAPLLAPLGLAYGYDPVHFAIMVIVNLQIGYVMPPVALSVIVATSVFRQTFLTVSRAVLPFVALMLMVLLITIMVPQLSLMFIR